MSTLRISDAPLLSDVDGTEKIPTGGRGDYTISVDQIKDHIFQDIGKELVGLGNVDNTSDLDKPVSTAQQAALNLKADKTYVDTNLDLKADKTNVYTRSETSLALSKKADLVGGVIPESQIPSSFNDVLEFTASNLPIIGESGKIYVTTDTNRTWRWSGNQYVEISNGGISDSTLKLQTPRKIANVDFDGTQSIDVPHNNLTNRNVTNAHAAEAISTATGENQQDINDYNSVKWRNKSGGYDLNARVMLDNGDIVKSTVSGNTVNPNTDMTGWENFESDQKAINDRLFNSIELSSTQFSITGVGDETAKVQALVDFANANSWVSKILIGSNITSSELMIFNRAVEIDFNGHTFSCTKDAGKFAAGIMFKGVVDTDTYSTLTVDNTPLSNKYTVNDASIFQIGDYVSGTYKRSNVATATYASEDIVFTAKILNISGNDLYLDHAHGFGIPVVQPWGSSTGSLAGTQLDICKSYPLFSPKVKNLGFTNPIASTATRVNVFTLVACIDAELANVVATGIGGQVLHNIGCRGTRTNNLSTVNPRATTGGRGYVVQENGSHDSEHDNLTGINERHTHDASTMSSRIKVKNSRGIGSANYSFGCHSSYIYDVTIENCDGSGGFSYGNSTTGNPTDGYFGGATGEITLKNVASEGAAAKIYLSPLFSVGTNRIIDSKIPSTSEVYGVRISANTVTQNCQFDTRIRVNKHQDAKPTVLTDTECTTLEGGQTNVVGQPDIIVRGGVIRTAQYLSSLTMDSGASIRSAASTNLLAVNNFKIQGGSIEVTGATSDFTLTADASISESTNVVVGRSIRLSGGNIEINSKNVDAEIVFTSATPVKLTATGAYIRNLNMSGGGANCKLQINNSEINYIIPKADFNYVIFTSNKVNSGAPPMASTRYIVDNNLTG